MVTIKPILFLTGSTGSLGKATRLILESKYEVICPKINLLNSDTIFRELEAYKTIPYIVHIAGISDANLKNHHNSFEDNVDMARNIVSLAKAKETTKIIFISSNSVNYSHRPYAVSKKNSEDLIRTSKIPFVILRPTLILGPDSPEIKKLLKLIKLPIIPLIGANAKIQPIYVDDVSQAILLALESSLTGSIFNIGGRGQITTKSLLKILLEATCKKRPILEISEVLSTPIFLLGQLIMPTLFSGLKDTLGKDLIVDNDEARSKLGWTPKATKEIETLLLGSFPVL